MSSRHPLENMDWVMWLLSAIVFAVPVFFLYTEDPRLVIVAFVLLALCGLVWAWGRPSYFEIDDETLVIRWPLRSQTIRRAHITAVDVVTRGEFQERFGWSMRLGVGGLFGQFGWAWTSKGLVTTYVSTLGPFVLLELETSRPLLITPRDPERFVRELTAAA